MNRVVDDLAAIKEEFSVPRRTEMAGSRMPDESAVQVQEVVFVLDRFGYCKLLDKSTYEKEPETVTEQVHVVRCLNTDKIACLPPAETCIRSRSVDVPAGKLRDKGVPIENLNSMTAPRTPLSILHAHRI